MEKLQVYKSSSVEWKPSPVVALASSCDGSQVAAAREDGALEIWLVSPGSVGWHCQLTIQGDSSSRISSLAWCSPCSKKERVGRLLSSSIDGSVSEWDLFSLKQKNVLDSVGVSIWQMALEPPRDPVTVSPSKTSNGHISSTDLNADSESESSKVDNDDDSEDDDNDEYDSLTYTGAKFQRLAMACDDGSVRLYNIPESDGLNYIRSFPRVTGRILSVAWSHDAKFIFSGSSDGLIRCWNSRTFQESYRITAGLGGTGSGPELCIWSLLSLRCGTLVSGDSTGSVQFWDSRHGTLLQAHTYHKGDVNALASIPTHNRVFSSGSDGQVILYKPTNDEDFAKQGTNKWVYVGYVRAHTHDVRALTMALPISREDAFPTEEKGAKIRRREKPLEYSYHKWAHLGVPMLISAGDDAKLFAYSAREFTQFAPHDISPSPQRPLIQLSSNTNSKDGSSLLLVQSPSFLDILHIKVNNNTNSKNLGGHSAPGQLLVRLKSKGDRKIICSAISGSGTLLAYSDNVKPSMFQLTLTRVKNNINNKSGNKGQWSLEKIQLPKGLRSICSMTFSTDSSCLMLAGHDRKIYVVDVKRSEIISTFTPQRKSDGLDATSENEPPVTKMFTSHDGQWLAAVNCFGDIYVFNLETHRQHWYMRRMNDASVTAGGFSPKNGNVMVITTSSNEVYVLDVEARELGEWSRRHTHSLPRRFQEFPGEVFGLSFPSPLSSPSTSVIVYSSRAMCFIDFGVPVDLDNEQLPNGSDLLLLEKYDSAKNARSKRKRKDQNPKNQNQEEEPRNYSKRKNFDFCAFRDPVLFVGHLSEGSLLIVEKRWMDVVQAFDAPVHRHIYGT